MSSQSSLSFYANKLHVGLDNVNMSEVNKLLKKISEKFFDMKDVYLIGNGGSAANASHIAGDYMKTFAFYKTHLKINCLTDNSCYLTAAANDFDFSEVFEVLVNTRIVSGDLIIFLSGSGNSMNLIKAALAAKTRGITVASITGYTGGEIAKISEININVPVDDMEIAEDAQLIIMHYVKQMLTCELESDGKLFQSSKYLKRVQDGLVA